MTTRKVCIYCQKWANGGIESFLYNVLTHMDRTGLAIDLVADRLCPSVFTEPLEALGVRFVELSGSLKRIGENRRRFRALLRERQYDAVHVNAFQGLSLAMLKLAKKAGVAVRIAHSHNTALRPSVIRPLKLLLHRTAVCRYGAYATDRWACSGAASAFLFGSDVACRMIPNGIDTGLFQFDPAVRDAVREELGLQDRFVIGNVGRLCSQKNQSFLLEVFQRICVDRPDSTLLLVGEGADRTALQQKAERLQVGDRVIFYGTSSNVERLLWAMDVFCFPSCFEGLGIVAVEAQTAGLPVLCSSPVPDEAFVTPLARKLPLSADPAVWAETLCAMADGSDRMGTAADVKAAGFDIEDVAKLVEDAYRG